MLEVKETFPYSLTIGKRKIEFRNWKTKDEKAFLILNETVENPSDSEIFETLIRPCMKDSSIYLSEAEQKLLMIEIRKKSLGESFNVKFVCKNDDCKSINEVDVEFNQIMNLHEDTLDEITIDGITFVFNDIKNVDVLKEKIKDVSIVEKRFIELIMRIGKIIMDDKIEDSFSYQTIYDFIDNLDTKVFDKLLKYYDENITKLELRGTLTCFKCNHENNFYFDEIPNFLEGW